VEFSSQIETRTKSAIKFRKSLDKYDKSDEGVHRRANSMGVYGKDYKE
jgi:hypothetical protein